MKGDKEQKKPAPTKPADPKTAKAVAKPAAVSAEDEKKAKARKASEIDDIFADLSSRKAPAPVVAKANANPPRKDSQTPKKPEQKQGASKPSKDQAPQAAKKAASESGSGSEDDDDDEEDYDSDEEGEEGEGEPKQSVEEIAAAIKKAREDAKKKGVKPAIQVKKDDEESDDGFSDSRGIRKKKRKVIDGLRVFDEDELGLTKNLTGGGTPLCPFDCNCCF